MRAFWCFCLLACRVEVGAPLAQQATCAPAAGRVVVYTSMYRSVLDALDPLLDKALPEIEVEWLQGGSEKLSARLDAELEAGAPGADLVMTSDPLWYERQARAGHLMPHAALGALLVPREWIDPEGRYVPARVSSMVLAYDKRSVSESEAPQTFLALFEPRWKGKVTMPDPLGSGTTFTTLAFLEAAHGPMVLERIKSSNTVASGGNTAALARLESGEQQVAMLLLENVLSAQARGSPIAFKLPAEGAVTIPGPIAILTRAKNPAAARRVYDFLLSAPAQAEIVRGLMHSPLPDAPALAGAPELEAMRAGQYRWSRNFLTRTASQAASLRHRFAAAMEGP